MHSEALPKAFQIWTKLQIFSVFTRLSFAAPVRPWEGLISHLHTGEPRRRRAAGLVSSRCDLLLCTYFSLLYLFCMEVEVTPCLLVASRCKPGCFQCEPRKVPCAALGRAVGLSPPRPPPCPPLPPPSMFLCPPGHGTHCFAPIYPRLFSQLLPSVTS